MALLCQAFKVTLSEEAGFCVMLLLKKFIFDFYIMTTGSGVKIYYPVIYLFLALSAIILVLKLIQPQGAIDYNVLLSGNFLLFGIGWLTLRMNKKAMEHKNLQVFLRLIYGSFLVKFFFLAIAAFIYIAIYKKNINKPALFGCFGFYLIYTIVEVRSVMKLSKKSNA
jgi:hypothetical protein